MRGVLTLRAEFHLDSTKKLGSGRNPLPDTGRRVSHVSVPVCFHCVLPSSFPVSKTVTSFFQSGSKEAAPENVTVQKSLLSKEVAIVFFHCKAKNDVKN